MAMHDIIFLLVDKKPTFNQLIGLYRWWNYLILSIPMATKTSGEL
jgi:hypothetical protein